MSPASRNRSGTLCAIRNGLAFTLVNDTAAEWAPTVDVLRIGLDGRELARTRLEVSCQAGALVTLPLDQAVASPTDPHAELLIVDADGVRTTWAYRTDRTLTAPQPVLEVTDTFADGVLHLTVTARTVTRDICVFPDRLATPLGVPPQTLMVDTSMVTLLQASPTPFISPPAQTKPCVIPRSPRPSSAWQSGQRPTSPSRTVAYVHNRSLPRREKCGPESSGNDQGREVELV